MKCLVPGCSGDAGEFGVCLGHLSAYRKGDAEVKRAMDAHRKDRARRGDPETGDQKPETRDRKPETGNQKPEVRDGVCRVPGCSRPATRCAGRLCAACAVYYYARGSDTERRRAVEKIMEDARAEGVLKKPRGPQAKRKSPVFPRTPRTSGRGASQPRPGRGDPVSSQRSGPDRVRKMFEDLGLAVIDVTRPGRVVINYAAGRCVFLETGD